MKHKVPFFSLFLFFLSSLCFSKEIPHGINLCRQVQENLADLNLNTQISPLVHSTSSEIPFNISVNFPSRDLEIGLKNPNIRKKLLFVIPQYEVFQNADFYNNLFILLSAENLNFDITFLLSYGINPETAEIPGFFTISGEDAFISELEDKNSCAAILISPVDSKSKVISGSGELTSSTWLVKTVYDSINKNRILNSFNCVYASFLYKLNLYNEEKLESFLDAGIPAVYIKLNNSLSQEQLSGFFLDICKNYNLHDTFRDDTHSLMITFFHKSIWIDEATISKQIIIVIALTFMLLMLYGFLNSNFSFVAWKKLKAIWYYPLIIFAISTGVFFAYRHLSNHLREVSFTFSTYLSICFVMPLIYTILALFFSTVLKFTPTFKNRTVDYLTLITGSINLFLFSLLDISLFPIFAAEFVLAWISTIFPQTILHMVIMVLFELPFLPFLLQLFGNADPILLEYGLRHNLPFPFALFLIMLPQYLNCFRVFTGMNFYWFRRNSKGLKKDWNNIILFGISLTLFEIIISLILPPSFKSIDHDREYIKPAESNEQIIQTFLWEQNIFNDKIQTLIIESSKELEYCDVRISGETGNPVIFTDNDSFTANSKTTVFKLPYQPPENMVFTFGTSGEEEAEITINLVYKENGKLFSQKIVKNISSIRQ